jgi:hypothetical protein
MNEARRTRAAVHGGDKIVAPSCKLSIAKRGRIDRELAKIRLIRGRAIRSRDFQRQCIQTSTISLIIGAAESSASPSELLNFGITVSQAIASRHMPPSRRDRRSQAWRTFTRNHATTTVQIHT